MKTIAPWTILPDHTSNNIRFSATSVNLIEGTFKNILLLKHWRRDNKIFWPETRCAELISACVIAKNGCYMVRIWRAVVFKGVVCAKHKPSSAVALWLWNLFPAVLWIMMTFKRHAEQNLNHPYWATRFLLSLRAKTKNIQNCRPRWGDL